MALVRLAVLDPGVHAELTEKYISLSAHFLPQKLRPFMGVARRGRS